MNPNMPKTGEQIYCVKIYAGKLEVTQEGTVRERNGFLLTENEFTTTHGSRYDCAHLFPGGEPSHMAMIETWPETSIWMYCTEAGKLGALDRLKSAYVGACIAAEEDLQSRARKLHGYAFLAERVEL
jgi:hypothetical protein